MPEPPATSLFTTHVLENPWPLGGLLLLVAAVLIWRGLRDGAVRVAGAGGLVAVAAIAVFLVALLVITPGERARPVVRSLVHAAELGDTQAMMLLFTEDATLHFARPENPGVTIESLRRAVGTLGDIHRIDSNAVTRLRAYGVDSDRAIVHLSCRTTTTSSRGAVPSRWVLHVELDDDGVWRVARITCVSVAGQSAMPSLFRL